MFAAHLWSMSKQIACLCTFVKLNRSWLNMQNRLKEHKGRSNDGKQTLLVKLYAAQYLVFIFCLYFLKSV